MPYVAATTQTRLAEEEGQTAEALTRLGMPSATATNDLGRSVTTQRQNY